MTPRNNLVRMAYSWPERLQETVVNGKTLLERIPGHPTRPARAYELGWWEESQQPESHKLPIKREQAQAIDSAITKKLSTGSAAAFVKLLDRTLGIAK